MRVRVKLCGITRGEDAQIAVSLGIDALGFIFHEPSPRYIPPDAAGSIIATLPPFVTAIGVFVDPSFEHLSQVVSRARLGAVQLHGAESPRFCSSIPIPVIKSFPVSDTFHPSMLDSYSCCSGYLLDTWNESIKGGTGVTFDWRIAARVCERYPGVLLAGGLGPSNLQEALECVHPYGIDLNSGVEISPGVKNPHKLRDAMQIIRSCS